MQETDIQPKDYIDKLICSSVAFLIAEVKAANALGDKRQLTVSDLERKTGIPKEFLSEAQLRECAGKIEPKLNKIVESLKPLPKLREAILIYGTRIRTGNIIGVVTCTALSRQFGMPSGLIDTMFVDDTDLRNAVDQYMNK